MDPLTSLSVAAAAVQFLDFGTRLVHDSVTLYRGLDGDEHPTVELSRVSADLLKLSQAIDDKIAIVGSLDRPIAASEGAIISHCRRCQEICREMSELVDKIHGTGIDQVAFARSQHHPSSTGSKLKSFRVAALTLWNEDKIAGLKQRLAETKSDLMLSMTINLW